MKLSIFNAEKSLYIAWVSFRNDVFTSDAISDAVSSRFVSTVVRMWSTSVQTANRWLEHTTGCRPRLPEVSNRMKFAG